MNRYQNKVNENTWVGRHRRDRKQAVIVSYPQSLAKGNWNSLTKLLSLNHDNIVQVYDIVASNDAVYIAIEKCGGGPPAAIPYGFEESVCIGVMHQIAQAVDYLHRRKIVIGNLQLKDILCTKPDVVEKIKISNFGIGLDPACIDIVSGESDYMAPEMINTKNKSAHNKSVDYWSLGVIMFVLLTGHPPPQNKSSLQLSGEISSATRKIVTGLLQKDPSKRLTCKDIIKHKYEKSAVWDKRTLSRLTQRKSTIVTLV